MSADCDDIGLSEEYNIFKSETKGFSKHEEDNILGWIVKNKAFKLVKMDSIWMRMAMLEVFDGRPWQLLKRHFHDKIIHHLNGYKGISHCDKLKLKMCININNQIDAEKMHLGDLIQDTDMEDESYSFPIQFQDKIKHLRKENMGSRRHESQDLTSDDDSQFTKRVLYRRKRKYAKVPADKPDNDHNNTSATGSLFSSTNTDRFEDGGIDKDIENLLNNSQLRSNTQADKDLTQEASINLEVSKGLSDVGADLELPSAQQFSDGLRGVHLGQMSQERDRSLAGVTSTVRIDQQSAPANILDMEEVGGNQRVIAWQLQHGDASTSEIQEDNADRIENAKNDVERMESMSGDPDLRGSSRLMTGAVEVNHESNLSPSPRPPELQDADRDFPDDTSRNSAKDNFASHQLRDGEGALNHSNFSSQRRASDSTENRTEESVSAEKNSVKLEAQLGYGKGRDVFLIVRGLPKDIDSNNIELIKTKSLVHLPEEEVCGDEDFEEGSNERTDGRKKLKILSMEVTSQDYNGNKTRKEWRKTGRFQDTFRTPYTSKVN